MAVVIACSEYLGVSLEHCGLLGEFVAQKVFCVFERAVEEPTHKAESEDVAALEHTLVVETTVGQGCFGHGGYGNLYNLSVYAQLGYGIVGGVLRFLEVSFFERIAVHDYHTAGL